jgi:hypothetical protein
MSNRRCGKMTGSSNKIGLVWSYNDDESNLWMKGCINAINLQGYVWWDVGWKIDFTKIAFPTTGYIWSTNKKQIEYKVTIEPETNILKETDTDKKFAEKVAENWDKMKMPHGWNDRLHEYISGTRNWVTLLKLSEIHTLNTSLSISDLTLWNGKVLQRPPQGANRIIV